MAKILVVSTAVVSLSVICIMPVRGGADHPGTDIIGITVLGGKAVPNRGAVDFGETWAGGKERVISFNLKYRGQGDFDGGRVEIRDNPAFSKRPYQNSSKFVQRYTGGYRFNIAFAPRRHGRHRATLIVRSGYTGTGVIDYVVQLSGTAWRVEYLVLSGDGTRVIPCGPCRSMAETGTDFGRVRVGSSTSRMFLITNRWQEPWLNPSIRIAGEHAEDFLLPVQPPVRIIRGQKVPPLGGDHRLSQYVYFAPKSEGIRRARILIRSGSGTDRAEPCEIHIQGEAFE